jgi:hypothetical protein
MAESPRWIRKGEYVWGEGDLEDVLNRPLRDVLNESGYQTDGSDFAGFVRLGEFSESSSLVLTGSYTTARHNKDYWITDPFFAVPTDGVTGCTSALTNLLNTVPDGGRILCPPGYRFVLDDTWYWQTRTQVSFISPTNTHLTGYGATIFAWSGSAGKAMVMMDKCKYCTFQGIQFATGNADVGLEMDGYAPGNIGTQSIVKRCWFSNDNARSTWVGVRIAHSASGTANQEYHEISECVFYGSNVGVGLEIGHSSNAKDYVIERNSFQNCTIGVNYGGAGIKLMHNSFTSNTVDVWLYDCQDACLDQGSNSEMSAHHLIVSGAGNNTFVAGIITVQAGRFDVENAPVGGPGYFRLNNALQAIFIGNSLDGVVQPGATVFSDIPEASRGLLSMGNYYGSNNITLDQLGLQMNVQGWTSIQDEMLAKPSDANILSNVNSDSLGAYLSSVMVGDTGSAKITGIRNFSASLTPLVVSASRINEQTFTVPGVTVADKIIINPPTAVGAFSPFTTMVGARVIASNTLAIQFINPTTSSAAPVTGSYSIIAIRT